VSDQVDRDTGLFGSVRHFGHPRGPGTASVEAHEPVTFAERHRRPVQELLYGKALAGYIGGLADLQRTLRSGPLVDPPADELDQPLRRKRRAVAVACRMVRLVDRGRDLAQLGQFRAKRPSQLRRAHQRSQVAGRVGG
jgi:hypothetical protein